MKAVVGFSQCEVSCIIGIHDDERKNEQTVLFDIDVGVDVAQAVRNDSLAYAVDYEQLAQICKKVACEGRFFLLEKLAHSAAVAILEAFPNIAWVKIKTKKAMALESVRFVFVELKINQNELTSCLGL